MQYKEVTGGICAPKGFAAAGVHCGIRANHSEKYDLALIKADAVPLPVCTPPIRCAAHPSRWTAPIWPTAMPRPSW
jgi:N-acetylglutamate synthase/N-acetylornithine aminotransferase